MFFVFGAWGLGKVREALNPDLEWVCLASNFNRVRLILRKRFQDA